MKQSIEVHERNLANMKQYAEREKAKMDRRYSEFYKLVAQIKFYHDQISEAKHQKKDGFDSALFLQQKDTTHVELSVNRLKQTLLQHDIKSIINGANDE